LSVQTASAKTTSVTSSAPAVLGQHRIHALALRGVAVEPEPREEVRVEADHPSLREWIAVADDRVVSLTLEVEDRSRNKAQPVGELRG
jgi:hypothetical protein